MSEPTIYTVQRFYFDTDVLEAAMQRCSFYNDLLSKTAPGSDV